MLNTCRCKGEILKSYSETYRKIVSASFVSVGRVLRCSQGIMTLKSTRISISGSKELYRGTKQQGYASSREESSQSDVGSNLCSLESVH